MICCVLIESKYFYQNVQFRHNCDRNRKCLYDVPIKDQKTAKGPNNWKDRKDKSPSSCSSLNHSKVVAFESHEEAVVQEL